MHKENDFYCSARAFSSKLNIWDEDPTINEAFIDGRWVVFTEQISVGQAPLSIRWGDLKLVGSCAETRAMPYSRRIEMEEDLVLLSGT